VQGHFARQTRFAASAGAGEGQEPRILKEASQLFELPLTSNEPREMNRQLSGG